MIQSLKKKPALAFINDPYIHHTPQVSRTFTLTSSPVFCSGGHVGDKQITKIGRNDNYIGPKSWHEDNFRTDGHAHGENSDLLQHCKGSRPNFKHGVIILKLVNLNWIMWQKGRNEFKENAKEETGKLVKLIIVTTLVYWITRARRRVWTLSLLRGARTGHPWVHMRFPWTLSTILQACGGDVWRVGGNLLMYHT